MCLWPRTRGCLVAVALLLLAVEGVAPAQPRVRAAAESLATRRGERELEGSWLIVKMVRGGKPVDRPATLKMTMSFRISDHSWRLTVETKERSFTEAGRWRLDGSRLITTTEDGSKVERMRVRSIGSGVLELKKTGERLVLKKQANR
jgi:hypothetical protein